MLDGKRTYIGLAVALLGYFGLAQIIGGTEEVTRAVDSALALFGFVMAVYGRYKATK